MAAGPANSTLLTATRMEALSDGVFGVALTLLVATFDVLKLPQHLSAQGLRDILFSEWSDLLHYVESFLLVAAFWIQHHSQFHFIKRTDWRLLWLNMLGLMLVVLIPVTNCVVGDYGQYRSACLVFEGNMLATGMVFLFLWVYVTQDRRLVEADLDHATVRRHLLRAAVIPGISVAAIAVSVFEPRTGTLLFFVIPILSLLAARQQRIHGGPSAGTASGRGQHEAGTLAGAPQAEPAGAREN